MYLPDFDEDREERMVAALDAGVYRVALPNIDADSMLMVKEMMRAYPNQVIGMMGLHPSSVKEDYKVNLNSIKTELDSGNYCAVGEIGIDLYWDKTYIAEQKEAFKIQLGWAKEMKLPVAIHSRDSFAEICEVLDEVYDDSLSGVFHCFTGNEIEMEKALSYKNFYLGIGGVLTFKNSGLDSVIAKADLNRLVLETDAPYLTPHPFRGKRNETAYTKIVARKLAEVFEISLEEVARITTANANTLFKMDGL